MPAIRFMSLWTKNTHEPTTGLAEDLAYAPSGGRIKMWLLGVAAALIPIGYGVQCLITGHARLYGSRRSHLDLDGPAAVALAIAYIAIGAFIHFHWFWGLSRRLEPFSHLLKALAVLVFVGGLAYMAYQIVL